MTMSLRLQVRLLDGSILQFRGIRQQTFKHRFPNASDPSDEQLHLQVDSSWSDSNEVQDIEDLQLKTFWVFCNFKKKNY